MRRMVEKLLRQFGRELSVQGQTEEMQVFGLLQALTGSHQRLAQAHRGVLGLENPAQYLYIGPVEPEPKPGERILAGKKAYIVRTSELIYGAGGPVYCWAMCVEKGGGDDWAMNA